MIGQRLPAEVVLDVGPHFNNVENAAQSASVLNPLIPVFVFSGPLGFIYPPSTCYISTSICLIVFLILISPVINYRLPDTRQVNICSRLHDSIISSVG